MLAVHYVLVAILCVYGSHRFYHTLRVNIKRKSTKALSDDSFTPRVTVQLPLYNEKFVVERAIDAVARLDYPPEKLQIQIIDDSTDDSVDIAARRIKFYKDQGLDISHVRRSKRTGYKAGALADAMAEVSGEFIAIFDADFIPAPDFLRRSIAQFKDPKIGVVQSRWTYLNEKTNVLTRVQGIMLDAHFGIEQPVRYQKDCFFNFNGTAGIWRRTAIEDAGGWSADTLTEDLDLSYRAQMKGWKFIYLKDLECASEIPANMCAFKVQQHRWAKGSIEVMKKLLVPIWKSTASRRVKIEATFHLTGNFSYMLMFIDSVFFLIPSVHIRENMGLNFIGWLDIPLFVLASVSHAWFFLYGQKILHGKILDKLALMPVLLATSIGLGVNNGRAVIEALLGHVTEFERTPKIGERTQVSQGSTRKTPRRYKALSTKWADWLELSLALFYTVNLLWAIGKGYWAVTPFLLLFALGFFYTGLLSVLTRRRQNKGTPVMKTPSDPKVFISVTDNEDQARQKVLKTTV